jgi:acid phosphatase family membrane protein YuiD
LIAFLVLMNGFVASSRLEMKAHTPKELVIGFLLGIIPQLLLLRFWL